MRFFLTSSSGHSSGKFCRVAAGQVAFNPYQNISKAIVIVEYCRLISKNGWWQNMTKTVSIFGGFRKVMAKTLISCKSWMTNGHWASEQWPEVFPRSLAARPMASWIRGVWRSESFENQEIWPAIFDLTWYGSVSKPGTPGEHQNSW